MNTNTVCIGIPVREQPECTARTLAQLRACTRDVPVVLLSDGLSPDLRAALERSSGVRVMAWDRPLGDAACFNRLVRSCDADLYVLLENGSLVAPGWLECIEQALAANPKHGLAGPSTNLTWNEQQVFPDLAPDAASLARTARAAHERFGSDYSPLLPLHSLGDFCYAVKREVIDTIGAADEAYADGPCWEMDYNIRAARAGFTGLWVKAAVVWRMPQSAAQMAAETRRFQLNKRRYQDHFCGLRLLAQTRSYDSHCTGEECPHFAPIDSIITRREFPAELRATAVASEPVLTMPPSPIERTTENSPRVSCIMPTANRRPYIAQAIAAFLAQDYENRELIILDDGTDEVADLVPSDERIHYVRSARGLTLGAKRNDCCRLARGEIIVHWDDDDWHASWRLSYQVSALLAEQADICGLDRLWFYDMENTRAWQYVYRGRPRWLAGGSFCYRKSVWERRPFANVSAGEDTRFVREAPFRKIFALARDDFYVARVHSRNTCRKQTSGSSWRSVAAPFVRAMIDNATPPMQSAVCAGGKPVGPLVSCIMPTHDRPEFVPLAIELFQRQSYANRELVIVDDGQHAIRDLLPEDDRIRYLRVEHRMSLGEKRNLACEHSRGEFVAHWDDDDWYGENRLVAQLAPLNHGEVDATALSMTFVLNLRDMRFWRCRPSHHARIHFRDLCPGTLAFRRRLWTAGARYAAINCAEDVAFINAMPRATHIARIPDEQHFVCVRHNMNTWSIQLDWQRAPGGWESIGIPAFIDEAHLDRYRRASMRLTGSTAAQGRRLAPCNP
jgi:glycosyltransferase involved in cell wall biosynthesis